MNDATSQTESLAMQVDVCVIGGGSAGYSAALAAAQNGLTVALVEKQDILGGTSTQAFVSSWASSPSGLLQTADIDPTLAGYSLPQIIYQRMLDNQNDGSMPSSVGITSWFNKNTTLPNGKKSVTNTVWALNPKLGFENTLLEYKKNKSKRSQVTFLPLALHTAVTQVMAQQPVVPQVLLNTRLTAVSADAASHSVTAVTVTDNDGKVTSISASTFIDASGDLVLCQALEALHNYDLIQSNSGINPLNYLSVCFRVVTGEDGTKPISKGSSGQIVEQPDGSYVINPLGEANGLVYTNNLQADPDTGYQKTYASTETLSGNVWAYMLGAVKGATTSEQFFSGYKLDQMAPFLGIRESYRLNGRYTLSDVDCITPITADMPEPTELIALADHNFDIIGEDPPCGTQVCAVYGVPFDCLRPQQDTWNNLLVACRGAGLDHWAASSCRLERVMMQFGQAAGTAAALARTQGVDVAALLASDVATALHMSDQLPYYYNLMAKDSNYGWPPATSPVPTTCPGAVTSSQEHMESTAR